jgi:predicted dehydrogenase
MSRLLPHRRTFLQNAVGAALAAAAGGTIVALAGDPARRRVGIVGHTGRGDYGHGLDVCFVGVSGVEVVAVADPDDAGRAKAAAKSKAARQYADYREMLAKEKPDIAVIAPRWSEHHAEMALAAIAAGAHLFMEKPIAVSPAEADQILAAAEKANRKITVAHQMRLAPSVVHLKKRIDEGLIGDLLELRAFGKQDPRAGGEDLLVLGVHLFDLMRMFTAADPLWCSARVTQQGREITREDARAVKEQIGKVAGDEVVAQFAFPKGISASFTSRSRLKDHSGHWGIEMIGSKGSARILADIVPNVFVSQPAPWTADGRTQTWTALPGDPAKEPGFDKTTGAANRRLVDDFLDAITKDRDPICSGKNAAWALEMVMGVYRSALSGARAEFPLKDRNHPL